MPRNASGVYSLPVTAFVSASVIISGDVNSDFSDIAQALSQSLATTGVTTMAGPVRMASGAVTAPGMAFNSLLGTGFYLAAANVLGVAVASVAVAQVNVSATVSWGYSHIFNSLVSIAGAVASVGNILSTTTVTGALDITGGMIVGFTGTPVVDTLALGDANLLFDFNSGTAPRLQFDTNDRLSFTRASNIFSTIINNVTAHAVHSDRIYYNGRLDYPEVSAPSSAVASTVMMYAKDSSDVTRMFYKDDNGNEIPMGGIGYWEVIATITLTTSVATYQVNLNKTYSRLMFVGTSVAPAQTVLGQALVIQTSDNQFTDQPAFDGTGIGLENGGNGNRQTLVGGLIIDQGTWTAGDECSFTAEVMNADKVGFKSVTGYGMSVTNPGIMAMAGSNTLNTYGILNALRMVFFFSNIATGAKFTLYGQAAN